MGDFVVGVDRTHVRMLRRRSCAATSMPSSIRLSAGLMATHFRPTQTAPTCLPRSPTSDGPASHPYWPRMDRPIGYIWASDGIDVLSSEACFNRPSPDGNVTETGFERVAGQGRLLAWIGCPTAGIASRRRSSSTGLALSPVHAELPGRGGATGRARPGRFLSGLNHGGQLGFMPGLVTRPPRRCVAQRRRCV
jgi:hypothetical protein